MTYSNLLSVTEHFHPLHWHSGQHQLPGVFLAYEVSGMKVLGLGFGSAYGCRGVAVFLACGISGMKATARTPTPLTLLVYRSTPQP